jgi:hypothetical protein
MMVDQAKSGIVWLASYPRSGNTWLRIFLVRLLSGGGEPVDINELRRKLSDTTIASNRATFDQIAGIDSSELDPDDIDRLRPRVYETVAAASTETPYIKVHDAYLLTPAGEPLMPVSATRATIYIVRNPLDVAVSLTFFRGHQDFDSTIARMANPDEIIAFKPSKLSSQLRQRLSTWSGHVTSWIDAAGIKCHLMRYEDMVHDPLETFTAMARYLGLPHDGAAIQAAIESTRFDNLRDAEEQRGFIEKPTETERFFRAGRVGDWREYLSAALTSRIIADHRTVMDRLGYLNPDGSPKI